MNMNVKKLLRTLQVNFPFLLEIKFALMREYRNRSGVPFDGDFQALGLFPDVGEALFLDVGANRGQSADAILMITKNSRIQLFEPNPLLCEKLRRLYGNNKRVGINEFGLGDKAAEQVLFVPFYKKWMFDGLASFDKEKAGDWLKGRVFFYKDRHLSLRESSCEIRRLDELNFNPFFIKLDIQGYEFQALKGGEQTIKTCEPVLLIESPPEEEVINYLNGFGYQLYAFKEGMFMRGVAGGNNTFFMTENKSRLVKAHITAVAQSR